MGNNFRFLVMIGAAIMSRAGYALPQANASVWHRDAISRAGYALPQAPKQHAGLSREQQSIILQKAATKRERRNAKRAKAFQS